MSGKVLRSCVVVGCACAAIASSAGCQRSPRQALVSTAPVAVASTPAPSPTPAPAPSPAPPPVCGDPAKPPSVHLFVSPEHPVLGQPVRVIAVSDQPLDASLTLQAATGPASATSQDREGGPPYH